MNMFFNYVYRTNFVITTKSAEGGDWISLQQDFDNLER